MNKDAADVYAEALWELANGSQLRHRFLTELRLVKKTADDHPGYLRMLDSPALPREERIGMVQSAWTGTLHSYVVNFMCILIERGRMSVFPDAVDAYERLFRDFNRISTARVESAVELSDAQKETLRMRLERIARGNVELDIRVVPELIGGLRVEMNGKRYEGTSRAKLDGIRDILSSMTI